MVALGVVVVSDRGSAEAGAPLAGGLFTAPSPVQKTERNSPRLAGRAARPGMLSVGAATSPVAAMTMAPWPFPVELVAKMPGLKGANLMVCEALVTPFDVTVIKTSVWLAIPKETGS